MTFEILVGLEVTDDKLYAKYRAGMTPILTRMGGGFGYDFRVSEVLRSQTDARINRVFTIAFPDRRTKDLFFDDASYKAVRKEFFEPSVKTTTIIAEYER